MARDRASKTFDNVGNAAERAGTKGSLFGKSMAGAFSVAAKAVAVGGAAIVGGLGVSITKAMGFDKTMRMVGATLGASGPVQKDLSALAMKLGKETAFSASDAGDAMLELAKGGMTAVQIKSGALASTLTLAAAGGLDLGAAATFVSNGLNTFGLNATNANKVAAALAGGANASSASVESLGQALQQVGPGAKSAGLSIETTTGILAAFDNAGIKGSDAGTSLKTMLTRLVPSTDAAAGAMEELGLKFTDAKGNFLPMTQVAQQLQDKLKGLSDEQKTQALTTIFGSDATRAALVLADLGAKGVAKYTAATSDQAAAQKLANTAMQGASGAWESFKGSIETIAIKLGVKLLPMFTNIVNGANNIASVVLDKMGPAIDSVVGSIGGLVAEWKSGTGTGGKFREVLTAIGGALLTVVGAGASVVSWLKEHDSVAKAAVITIGALVAVTKLHAAVMAVQGAGGLAAYIAKINIVQSVTKVWTAVQWLLNAALTANPIGLVIAGVAALTAGLIYAYNNSETFREIVSTAFSVVKDAALTMALMAVKAFHFLLGAWLSVAGGIINGAALAFGWVPGLGPKLQGAAVSFNTFKDKVNVTLSKIETDLEVTLETDRAKRAADAMAKYYRDRNWTATAALNVNMVYGGSGRPVPRAGGGPVSSSGIYAVGDNPDGSWNKTTELFVPNTDGRIYTQAQMQTTDGSGSAATRSLTDADIDAIASAVRHGAYQGTSAGFGYQAAEVSMGARR